MSNERRLTNVVIHYHTALEAIIRELDAVDGGPNYAQRLLHANTRAQDIAHRALAEEPADQFRPLGEVLEDKS